MNMGVFYKSLLALLGFFSVQTKAEREVNAARWGTVDQSTTYPSSFQGSNIGCIRTDNNQNNPWWRLDLKKTYTVNRVTITNRFSCCEDWINGAQIRIGNSPDVLGNPVCAVVSSLPLAATYNYLCNGMEGRYVTVNIPRPSEVLTFCEVAVYVISPGNLATGKTVTQSSTFGLWNALQAIDFNPGLTNSDWSWKACSSTTAQTNPWWRVDLGYIYKVSRVVITNRLDHPEKINGAEIRIGNSLENDGNDNPRCFVISSIPAGVSSTYTCNDMVGRYVNLFIPGDSRILTLCEVEVYGEEYFCEDEDEV